MSKAISSTNSPCAACKFLRRKCTQGCIFAPYFPPENPARFAQVHRVFGASNVAKLLNDLMPAQREDAVNSLAYEAEARLRDPVFGCVGYISLLQHRLLQLQRDLSVAKKELSSYMGRAALGPFLPSNQLYAESFMFRQQQQQIEQVQMMEAQQIAAAREEEMLRGLEQEEGMNGVEVLPVVGGGFEGNFTVLEQQQQGRLVQEGIGNHVHYFNCQRRRLDEGRSGVGPSS